MPQNPNLRFDLPQPILRTSARLVDDQGNQIDITLTGPEDLLRAYMERAPVYVNLIPPDRLPETINGFAAVVDANQQAGEETIAKEAPPHYPARALQIEIDVVQTALQNYGVHVEVDPDLPQGASHWYSVRAKSQAWATCTTTVGDADLYLYEEGVVGARASSIRGGTAADSVSANRGATGNWNLQVYGFIPSSYTLSGLFVAI